MPSLPNRPKLTTLKPRLQTLDTSRGLKTLTQHTRTLKQKQAANGRTLALDSAAWRRVRARVIAEQPLCGQCEREGRYVAGNEVDHIDNDPTNNERSNLENLCKACHSRKTNRDMGHNVAYGCDANGMPLDPNHPWNREKSPGPQPAKPTCSPSFNANRKGEP